MKQTGNEIIMSSDELWSTVREYVIYLRTHTQTSKLEELFDSMYQHREYYGRGLRPMLNMMSKYGMPHQFPTDESHLNQPTTFRCAQNVASASENKLIVASEFW